MGRAKRPKVVNLERKLKQIRELLNLTQSELIEKLDCQGIIYQANISEYESGRREPPLPVLLKYARAAGIHVDDLIDDTIELSKLSK